MNNSTEVIFCVVIADEIFSVNINPVKHLRDIVLKVKNSSSRTVITDCKPDQCTYHKLKSPVLQDRRGDSEAIIAKCMKEGNHITVRRDVSIASLSESFKGDYIYLVIQIPSDKPQGDTLIKLLQVTVRALGKWSKDDVERNGGVFLSENDAVPPEILIVQQKLMKMRTYSATHDSFELKLAKHEGEYFYKYFALARSSDPPTVTNCREYVAFYTAVRCFSDDAPRIVQSSSSLKTSSFEVGFFHPPFFSCQPTDGPIDYQENLPWKFPMFVSQDGVPDSWRKYTPRNDFSVISNNEPKFPLLIAEVISEKSEQDRWRMLMEGLTIMRAGRFLQRTKERFFVVAIYLNATMHADRYIMMQKVEGDEKVYIMLKSFNLTKKDEAISFLLEMFNLAPLLQHLADNWDNGRIPNFVSIKDDALAMRSLTSKGNSKAPGVTPITEPPNAQGGGLKKGTQDVEGDLGIFGSIEIISILKDMEYEIQFVLFGHPNVAVISNGEPAHLKFISEGTQEVEITQYLAGITSAANHTVKLIKILPVTGGHIMLMPVAGGWLTSLRNPTNHLWSVARQLFEAVAFMHKHHVAHMDLKPSNILLPEDYGRLTIIDFGLSVRVSSLDQKFTGSSGTEGYAAPEVGEKAFSAIHADLWSCGKVLKELCLSCEPSIYRLPLLKIADRLLDENPDARPMANRVLNEMLDIRERSPIGHVRNVRTNYA